MKWLVNYFRQCFCKHEWKEEEKFCTKSDEDGLIRQGPKISITCTKCYHHRAYWKYK